jgi:hypothetical protein
VAPQAKTPRFVLSVPRETATRVVSRMVDEGRRFGLCLALFAVTYWASGCSFLFVKVPPTSPKDREGDLDCTTSYVPPVLDSVLLVGGAYRTASALGKSNADYKDSVLSRPADIGLGLALTTLEVASALYGYLAVGGCHEAIDKLREDRARQNDAWRQRVLRSHGQLPVATPPAPDADADADTDIHAATAAQAKAFGEAARAASRTPARPTESK